jgi:glycerophosphoryl diester phosphodiesterase
VNDPAEMRRLLDMGVDGVMTDAPDVLKQVLDGRASWVT